MRREADITSPQRGHTSPGDRGDLADAERWHLIAADAGNTDAMNNVGFLLEERGDLTKPNADTAPLPKGELELEEAVDANEWPMP